jgi:hypothetical protein
MDWVESSVALGNALQTDKQPQTEAKNAGFTVSINSKL